MNKTLKIILGIVLAALIVAAAVLAYTNYIAYLKEQEEREQQELQTTESPELTPEPTPFVFEEPEGAMNVRLTFCGEFIGQSGLLTEAQTADGGYDFTPILSGATAYAQAADYAMCTMETTIPASTDYSGYPLLKAPVELATGLKTAGFNLISTATNHAMDSGKEGLDFTITALEQNELDHIGTYKSRQFRDETQGMVARDINGLRICFLSYTFGITDMSSLTGIEYAVNTFCTPSWSIDYDKLQADMQVARALNPDLIVVTNHWGTEFDTAPTSGQEELTNFLFAQGADVVIGGHSLVPQPIELHKIKDETTGRTRTCLVAYSLGSLASCYDEANTNLSVALSIDVQKDPETGRTYLRRVEYAPLFRLDLEEYGVTADWNFRTIDLHARMSDYEAGETYGIFNADIYNAMDKGLDFIHNIMGEQYDVQNGGVDVMLWNYEND